MSRALVYRAPGERDTCPACGSADVFDLDVLPLRAGRTGLVCGCDDCGLVFSNPLPTGGDLTTFYSPEGAWGIHRRDADEPAHASATAIGGSWTHLFDPIRDVLNVMAPPPGATVLDFGCGEGKLLDQMQTCGWTTFGIEPSVDRAFRRHQRLEAVPERPAFDLIVLTHVLEHVANPLQLLKQLAGACRVRGHLLVGAPRFDTLAQHRDYRYVLNGRAHITAYTWACLRTLLARSGWSAVAPPPNEISKGGGRRTTSRLRVVARRCEGAIEEPEAPAAEARAAVRAFYAGSGRRAAFVVPGLLRLEARRVDASRRRERAARKAAKDLSPEESRI